MRRNRRRMTWNDCQSTSASSRQSVCPICPRDCGHAVLDGCHSRHAPQPPSMQTAPGPVSVTPSGRLRSMYCARACAFGAAAKAMTALAAGHHAGPDPCNGRCVEQGHQPRSTRKRRPGEHHAVRPSPDCAAKRGSCRNSPRMIGLLKSMTAPAATKEMTPIAANFSSRRRMV